MQKILWIVLLIGCVGAARAQQREVRDVGTFQGIKAAEGIDVYVKKGDREHVQVEVSGNTELDNVITEVSGSYLKIHLRESRFLRNIHVKVLVTYVKLEKISASSAANIYSEGVVKAKSLEIGTSSAATVELTVEVDELEVTVSSAGDVELDGKARSVVFEASSAGQIDAYDLEASSVVVQVSSAGSIKLSVSDALTAHASSGGSIRYRGNPTKSMTNSSSGGSVKKSY